YARTFCIFSSILSALSLASNLFPPFPYTTLFRSIFSGALPMWYAIISQDVPDSLQKRLSVRPAHLQRLQDLKDAGRLLLAGPHRSEEHTSELQSRENLVCRLLLEKKKSQVVAPKS